ncbi:MAG: cupin [Candidatus Cloacimonetes bacterium HGW-Cloacimonetes-2]|jgi:quercetin dioxygenase-like cupin family protein|nr:MAG: cupin [Candidatus Cloacimonetes bacterium HGW-Cloacimonetes-2]
MKLTNAYDVELEAVNMEGAKGAKIRWLISQKDGAPTFAMRMFEVDPDGQTPYHEHTWEHEIYCLSGSGMLLTERGDLPFATDDIIYVDPNMKHAFKNVGTDTLKFLCIIPNEQPVTKKTLNPFAGETANNC